MSEVRLLTEEEIATVPGMVSPIPRSLFAVGVVDEQGVAAACGVFMVVHADPLWIRPDYRKGLGRLPLRIWGAALEEIRARNMGPEVFVGMTEETPGMPTEALVAKMCYAAGGSELKARFFVLPVYTARLRQMQDC